MAAEHYNQPVACTVTVGISGLLVSELRYMAAVVAELLVDELRRRKRYCQVFPDPSSAGALGGPKPDWLLTQTLT